MPNQIEYNFSCLDEAIDKIKMLKKELPTKKGSYYIHDTLYTGESKGDVIDRLWKIESYTKDRSKQIEILLDNVLMVLNNAKNQMKEKDEQIAKEIKG